MRWAIDQIAGNNREMQGHLGKRKAAAISSTTFCCSVSWPTLAPERDKRCGRVRKDNDNQLRERIYLLSPSQIVLLIPWIEGVQASLESAGSEGPLSGIEAPSPLASRQGCSALVLVLISRLDVALLSAWTMTRLFWPLPAQTCMLCCLICSR
jgi:hypothetical protein